MTTDLRELLENAVTVPKHEPNVTGAWRKAQRRNSLNRLRKVSMPVMALILVIVAALFSPIRLGTGSAGLGAGPAGAVPGWSTYDDRADGLTMSFPSGWTMAAGNLTPNLINPKELVALGTYSLNTNTSSSLCPQFPAAALNAMGSNDAFISILGSEPIANSQTNPFPARSSGGFDGSSGVNLSKTDFPQCLAHPLNGNGQWIAFSQAGRNFYVLAAVGTSASATLRSDVYTILNSIQVARS
jgi:hypothetical protein